MDTFKTHFFDVLDSTNDTAKNYPPFSVICADRQTKGKGRMGRKWESESGNLFMSVVLPNTPDAPKYSFIAALAVARTLSPLPVHIKWPNDILLEGKKVCGILLEAFENKLIIGIGVNVAHTPEKKMMYPVTSLAACGETVSSKELLNFILQNLESVIQSFDKFGFERIRQQWLEFAVGLHKTIKVRLPNGEKIGTFDGITENGALMLKTPNKKQIITVGDVFMI